MRLSTFIVTRIDALVAEWQAVCRASLSPLNRSDAGGSEDCLRGVLLTIARDMDLELPDKRGDAKLSQAGARAAAATEHGALRQQCGVGVHQIVNEFSLLRAAVLTRWYFVGARTDSDAVLHQSVRFNRAVDMAACASIEGFAAAATSARDTHLFTLGQDLRGPMSTVHAASTALARPDFTSETRQNVARRLRRALMQMDSLISDLLEYTRAKPSSGIPLDRSPCDLEQLCQASIDVARMAHPGRVFGLSTSGHLFVEVDAARIQRALSNLVHNAIQHGDLNALIKLSASGDDRGVTLSVWNAGRVIPEASLEAIFQPWVRVPSAGPEAAGRTAASLGLGLFITREIVLSHGGSITATSSAEAGTRFTIWLPRANEALVAAQEPSKRNPAHSHSI